ncbi:hypothetical protein ALQ30_200019 [Pseudomonas syringae pv. persicae]|uniref:Periplasmic binding protein/LacI sugar binding domain-containing protein n=1 Tax=Pseudomonas syringae pv. persicae TaxID=237306 RepID=A0A3M4AWQ7_9PSED|nr:hypothetical protein ALQ30_200019 [Pseudomonas syringae pv. persicae]
MDNTVLGGVRATSTNGFGADDVIGIGINGSDAIDELKKKKSGFFGSMLPNPGKEGGDTALYVYEWVTKGTVPPMYTALDDVILIERTNFKEILTDRGLWK